LGSRKQRFKDFFLGVASALGLTFLTDAVKAFSLTPEQNIAVALLIFAGTYMFYKYT